MLRLSRRLSRGIVRELGIVGVLMCVFLYGCNETVSREEYRDTKKYYVTQYIEVAEFTLSDGAIKCVTTRVYRDIAVSCNWK